MAQASRIEMTWQAHFRTTKSGRAVLNNPPAGFDNAFLSHFAGFRSFPGRSGKTEPITADEAPRFAAGFAVNSPALPQEALTAADQQITDAFIAQLINRLIAASPAIFHQAIVELPLAMGYGGPLAQGKRALGKTGDEGGEGVIDRDSLGVDQVSSPRRAARSRHPGETSSNPGIFRRARHEEGLKGHLRHHYGLHLPPARPPA